MMNTRMTPVLRTGVALRREVVAPGCPSPLKPAAITSCSFDAGGSRTSPDQPSSGKGRVVPRVARG